MKLRELFYAAHYVHSHIAHFYALAAADFVLGPMRPGSERGTSWAWSAAVGRAPSAPRSSSTARRAQKIQEMLGGKATHPVCGIPGGMSKPLSEDERKKIEAWAKSMVEFSKFTMQLFTDVVLKNEDYLTIITNQDIFYDETYNLEHRRQERQDQLLRWRHQG